MDSGVRRGTSSPAGGAGGYSRDEKMDLLSQRIVPKPIELST